MINISLQFSFYIIQDQLFCCAHVTNQNCQLRQYSNKYFSSILTLFCPVCQFIHSHTSKMLSRIVCLWQFRCHRRSKYTCFENTVKGNFQMEFRPTPSCFFINKNSKNRFVVNTSKPYRFRCGFEVVNSCRFETASV